MMKATKTTIIEKIMNRVLPDKQIKCHSCGHMTPIRRGDLRKSVKRWNGPFCNKCGQKL